MIDEGLFDAPGARCLAATPKAVFVAVLDLCPEGTWVPQSVIHDDSEVYQSGDEGTLIVEEWWAEKQGWL